MTVSTKPHSFFLMILGNHYNVLCTPNCCFSKGTFLQIYGVKDFDDQKHSQKMEYDVIFFKKMTFHFTELHSRTNGKNEDQPLNASSN